MARAFDLIKYLETMWLGSRTNVVAGLRAGDLSKGCLFDDPSLGAIARKLTTSADVQQASIELVEIAGSAIVYNIAVAVEQRIQLYEGGGYLAVVTDPSLGIDMQGASCELLERLTKRRNELHAMKH